MQNEQDEKKNEPKLSDNRATDNEEIEKNLPKEVDIAFINTNCSVCNSGQLPEIHRLRPTHTLRELAEEINQKYGLELSKDSLSRHFQHYTQSLKVAVVKKQFEIFQQETENIASHQKKTLFLGKIAFDHIVERLENGTLVLGVDDFEKLIKLYYGVLRDPDKAGDENIIAIFQRASEKMGCGLEQGVLIKKARPEV